MTSQRPSRSSKTIWTVMIAVLAAVFAFAGGYVVGVFVESNAYEFSIVDDYGRPVTLDRVPQRIVSISPSPTEILFAIGAGPQVVGVDNYSDYPAETANLPKIGSYYLDIETIVALKPDLIVGGDLVPLAQLNQLEDMGIPYVLLADRTLEQVLKTIRLAGVITGHLDEADQVAKDLEVRINAVKNKTLAEGVDKPMVYIEYDDFMGYWTYGPGSFGDDLITLAGGENVARYAGSEYPSVSSDFVVARNPEIIVYTTGSWATLTKDTYLTRSGWGEVDAVKTGNIHGIDANLMSRYGPRVVDCLEQLAQLVHPELFP